MHNLKPVSIQVLRETINSVFDFIEKDLGQAVVVLPSNYYWVVPDGDLYKMDSAPERLDCGSLADDVEFVESAHANREQAIPLMFMHLAPLLYALSKSVPSFTVPKQPFEGDV